MTITNNTISKLVSNRSLRIVSTQQDLLLFFSIYFGKYIKYSMAPFQIEMLKLLQDQKNKNIVITAFRNSAKSTFCSLLLPIWSIAGVHQMKNIIIVCQTEQKAEQTLVNLRRELESNKTLVSDHGTFYNSNEEWNKRTLVIAKYGARITVVSISESVRGVRHDEFRPDLIIFDDIEDVQSAKSQEVREKTWEIITREFIPLGTIDTRHIFIGNLVHPDSVMVKLRTLIRGGLMTGEYREYPLIKDKVILWPGQFPNMEAIDEFKKSLPSETDFLREYLLQIIPEGSQLIFPKHIKRYLEDDLKSRADFSMYLVLLDPAVSGERTSRHDKTGIIVIRIFGSEEKLKMYICPNPVNDWLEWPDIINQVKNIVSSFGGHSTYKILVEGGSTQKGLTQMLVSEGLNAQEVSPQGNDKRTRISMLIPYLSHKILFPMQGTEELEHQLIYFGAERYDDLVDALTLLALDMPEIEKRLTPEVIVANFVRFDPISRTFRRTEDDWAEIEDRKMFP